MIAGRCLAGDHLSHSGNLGTFIRINVYGLVVLIGPLCGKRPNQFFTFQTPVRLGWQPRKVRVAYLPPAHEMSRPYQPA
jgi:hypothetical protein